MFKQLVLVAVLCVAVCISKPTADEAPEPYQFQFEEKNENHTLARNEQMDQQGKITGTYSYIDRDGLRRVVNYVADDDGFRATVDSNEPGLISSAPAAATYNVQ